MATLTTTLHASQLFLPMHRWEKKFHYNISLLILPLIFILYASCIFQFIFHLLSLKSFLTNWIFSHFSYSLSSTITFECSFWQFLMVAKWRILFNFKATPATKIDDVWWKCKQQRDRFVLGIFSISACFLQREFKFY